MKHLYLLFLIVFLASITGCDDEEAVPTCDNILSFGPEVLRFPAPGLATINDFAITPNGVIATGMVDRERLHLSEFSSVGALNWTKTLGVDTGDPITALPVSTGGYLVGGRTRAFGSVTQFLLIRTDELGDELWTGDYGDPGIDNAAGIAETDANKFLIFGTTSETSGVLSLLSDLRLSCVNEDGSQEWTRTFNLSANDNALSFIRPDQAEEKYWGLVSTSRPPSVFNDLQLLEFSADGEETGRQTLAITDQNIWSPRALAPTSDGGAIVSISTREDDTQGVAAQASLIKLGPEGTTEWMQRYPAINSGLKSVLENADGGYTFIGDKSRYRQDESVSYVVKTSDRGTIRWCREFTMTEYGSLSDLVQLPDGGYLLTGTASSEPNPLIFSPWTLVLDENGMPTE